MKKIELRKKRRFNGSEDEIIKKTINWGLIIEAHEGIRKEEMIMGTKKADIR